MDLDSLALLRRKLFHKKGKKFQKGFGKIGLYAMILFHFLPFLPINDKSHHSLDKKEDGGYTN